MATLTCTTRLIPARAAEPLLATENRIKLGIREVPEGDVGDRVIDNGEARANEAHATDHIVGVSCKFSEHPACLATVARLAIHPAVEVHGRIDPQRDGALHVDGAGLALGMVANELNRLGVGRVVLLVDGGDDIEGDA